MAITVTTNHVPRDVIDAYELSEKERQEFGYLDWEKIERGEDSASFFRYKGMLYDLGEFQIVSTWQPSLTGWDGYISDTFFSGIIVKYVEDYERVIVGTFYAGEDS